MLVKTATATAAAASFKNNAFAFSSALVGSRQTTSYSIPFGMSGVRCAGQPRFRTYTANTLSNTSTSCSSGGGSSSGTTSSTRMVAAVLGGGSLLGLGCYQIQIHTSAKFQPVQCEKGKDHAKKEDHYYHQQMLDLCRKVVEEEDKTHMFWPPIVMILFGPPVRRGTMKRNLTNKHACSCDL
jgi:hypothetical protein